MAHIIDGTFFGRAALSHRIFFAVNAGVEGRSKNPQKQAIDAKASQDA
jgi:hypothetical protein